MPANVAQVARFNVRAKQSQTVNIFSHTLMTSFPGLSHVVGARTTPLLECTIGEALVLAAERHADRPFVVDHPQRVTLTYAGMLERSRALAAALGAPPLLLRPGDRVGVWIGSRWEWVVTQMACALAGLVLVNVNPAYRASELHYACKLVGVRALVMQAHLKSSDYHALLAQAGNVPSLEWVVEVGEGPVREGCLSFNDLLRRGAVAGSSVRPVGHARDACNIQFTSGTTGHPKGSTLSHRNILNNARDTGTRLGLGPTDVLVLPVPLYHCFGCVLGTLAALAHGASIVLPAESYDAAATLECASLYRASFIYGVPTMLLDVHTLYVKDPSKYDLSRLRGGAMGGSPCPAVLMAALMKDMHMQDLACVYGMTETSPLSVATNLTDSPELRCNTVGTVLDHVEVKVVDERNGQTQPTGVIGELWTKGYSVMLGYWGQPDKTKEGTTSFPHVCFFPPSFLPPPPPSLSQPSPLTAGCARETLQPLTRWATSALLAAPRT